MLHGTERTRIKRAVLLAFVTSTAVTVSALDGYPSPPAVEEKAVAGSEPFELGYLSPRANAFMACRPAVWFKQPGMANVSAVIDKQLAALERQGIVWPKDFRPEHIEQVVIDASVKFTPSNGKPNSGSLMFGCTTLFIRMDRDFDWLSCAETFQRLVSQDKTLKKWFPGIKKFEHDGAVLYRIGTVPFPKTGPMPLCMYLPDRRSAVFLGVRSKAEEDAVLGIPAFAAENRKRDWGSGLKRVVHAPFAFVADNRDGCFVKQFEKGLSAKDLKLLRAISSAAAAIELGDGKPVRLIVDAKSSASVPKLRQTFDRVAGRILAAIREDAGDEETLYDEDKLLLKLATDLLQPSQVHRHGRQIEWKAFPSMRLGDFFPATKVLKPSKETKQQLAEAMRLFRTKSYSAALPLFSKVANDCQIPEGDNEGFLGQPKYESTPASNRIGEEARFHEAECLRLMDNWPHAADTYHQMLLDYPNGTYKSHAIGHIFNIANFWLDDTRAAMRRCEPPSSYWGWPTHVWEIFFTERRKPLLDEEGRALEALEWAWLNDIMGPLADKCLFLAACVHLYREDYREADHYLAELIEMHPKSPLVPLVAVQALMPGMKPLDHVPETGKFVFDESSPEPKCQYKKTVDTKHIGCAMLGQLLRLCTWNCSYLWDRARVFARSAAREEFLAPRICLDRYSGTPPARRAEIVEKELAVEKRKQSADSLPDPRPLCLEPLRSGREK